MMIKNKRYFILTVDTEGDNLWRYKGGEIGTKNALFLPRFQQLCEKYGFKPVYLTNYEMINSDDFVRFAKNALSRKACEVGIHLHAWNNPPYSELPHRHDQNSYLIEYPANVRREKFKVLYNLISEKIGTPPISHRAGRWAMDDDYFKMLSEFGIKVDCSITPFISWDKAPGESIDAGSDYSKSPYQVHKVGNVLEVPMSIRRKRYLLDGNFKHKVKTCLFGHNLWMRPAMSTLKEMKYLIVEISKEKDVDFVEFMIHSSELMPNGSPYFRTAEDVEREYRMIESVFEYAKSKGFEGITLADYYSIKTAK